MELLDIGLAFQVDQYTRGGKSSALLRKEVWWMPSQRVKWLFTNFYISNVLIGPTFPNFHLFEESPIIQIVHSDMSHGHMWQRE